MPSGTYDFTVSVKNSSLQKSGRFTILEFDVEKQLLTTNVDKLDRLAKSADGQVFFPENIQELMSLLEGEQRFVPTQTGRENVVSLIDFQILLAIIAISLAAEWFIRKYIGLI